MHSMCAHRGHTLMPAKQGANAIRLLLPLMLGTAVPHTLELVFAVWVYTCKMIHFVQMWMSVLLQVCTIVMPMQNVQTHKGPSHVHAMLGLTGMESTVTVSLVL